MYLYIYYMYIMYLYVRLVSDAKQKIEQKKSEIRGGG